MAMIQLLNRVWRVVRVSWNLSSRRGRRGVRLARRVIRIGLVSVVVWPFVLLTASLTKSAGFVSVVALAPLLMIFFLAVVYPLISTALAAVPQSRTLFGWLFVVIFAELVIGLYLAAVPVWNSPSMIPVLALLVVVLGMWLVLKQQLGWRRGGWFSTALALAILGITIAFFFSGGKKAEAREEAERSEVARIEEFKLDAGKERATVFVGPGTFHRISADKPWIAISVQPDGTLKEYESPSSWKGGLSEGLLIVRGVEDGTTLRFERVR